MSRRIIALLCILLLALPLLPVSRAADEVCFTAVNDTVLPLTEDTMPVWSGGLLYVPYHVFDPAATGVSLGVSAIYNKTSGTVSVFNMNQMMIFDLEAGTCIDPHSNTDLGVKAIRRNGTAYVPAGLVCSFFEMGNPTYTSTDYGYLARIKNGQETMTNKSFISAAGSILARRLEEYTASQTPSEEPTPPPQQTTPPVQEPVPPSAAISTFLAFRCETGEAAGEIVQHLEQYGVMGLFFFPPDQLATQGDLVRQLLGTGHRVGILAQGSTPEETLSLLAQGNQLLSEVARTRTYFALTPKAHRQQAESGGWACWDDSLTAIPTGGSPYNFASGLLGLLPDQGRAYLTLDDSQNTAQTIGTLLYRLREAHYTFSIPRETRL